MDPALDPAIFERNLQDANKNKVFFLLLFEGTMTSCLKDKKSYKEVAKQ
jgi:hypothetical protein